jgi:hypothetical protein
VAFLIQGTAPFLIQHTARTTVALDLRKANDDEATDIRTYGTNPARTALTHSPTR